MEKEMQQSTKKEQINYYLGSALMMIWITASIVYQGL